MTGPLGSPLVYGRFTPNMQKGKTAMIGISYHAGGMKDLPLRQVVEILSATG